jgi:hypothetical protein
MIVYENVRRVKQKLLPQYNATCGFVTYIYHPFAAPKHQVRLLLTMSYRTALYPHTPVSVIRIVVCRIHIDHEIILFPNKTAVKCQSKKSECIFSVVQ